MAYVVLNSPLQESLDDFLPDSATPFVAIVSVRAGESIKRGSRCGLNEFNEAVTDEDGIGVADPFRKGEIISTGQEFWLLLDQDEVPNVRHEWEHPTVKFGTPTRPVKLNEYLQEYADKYGVTYQQLMDACETVVQTDESAPYPGTKSAEEIEEVNEDCYDLWSEWAEETGHEFYNAGSACCPEYRHWLVVSTRNP